MRRRDTREVAASLIAAAADGAAVFGGIMAAVWIRFDAGWIPLVHPPPATRDFYTLGAAVVALILVLIFRALGLYERPQTGPFSERIPRLVRGVLVGMLIAMAIGFSVRTEPPFARLVVALAVPAVLLLVLAERALLFRLEILAARRARTREQVLVVGTDATAARLRRALAREPRLRAQACGFLSVDAGHPHAPGIEPADVLGTLDDLDALLRNGRIDQVILADPSVRHEQRVGMVLACDRYLVDFRMVPDLFRVMTAAVEVQSLEGIPLLGLGHWPLDHLGNRILKRAEDIAGALAGLFLAAPLLAWAAWRIRRESPGPVFFRQARCGEKGRVFTLYKLRTMRLDAEAASGPVWTVEADPRCTRIGARLRRWNLDELPQFWNVLRGDMSLVGPRPERPFFVEKFREGIGRYMWRHMSRPGMTGWAQVNGLRGNTDIEQRIRHDLFYLENWSLALDFKILLKTLFTRENAY